MPQALSQFSEKDLIFLAFDFGTKKIGVAVGQMITCTASPVTCLHSRAGIPDWQHMLTLIEKWRPHALIVGIPVHVDGASQGITHKAKKFAKTLRQKFNILVYEVDERFSTVEARQILFDQGGYKALEKVSVDSFAAKLILEDWMRNFIEKKNA